MIRPEDWARMSWHARERAQRAARMQYGPAIAEEMIRQHMHADFRQRVTTSPGRAKVFKRNAVWYTQIGDVMVPHDSHRDAMAYLDGAAA